VAQLDPHTIVRLVEADHFWCGEQKQQRSELSDVAQMIFQRASGGTGTLSGRVTSEFKTKRRKPPRATMGLARGGHPPLQKSPQRRVAMISIINFFLRAPCQTKTERLLLPPTALAN
jgi:hypothetical protein